MGGWSAGGAGSAVAFTPDGYLVTSAHVVAGADRGHGRRSSTARSGSSASSAAIRSRTWPSSASDERCQAATLGDAARPAGRAAGRRHRQPARLRRLGDGRRRVRPRAARWRRATGGRAASSRTSSRPTPRSIPATPAARWPTASGRVVGINTAVAGVGLGLAVPDRRGHASASSPRSCSDGRVRRAYLGIVGGTRPLPPPLAGQPRPGAGLEVVQLLDGSPAAAAGVRPGDLILDARRPAGRRRRRPAATARRWRRGAPDGRPRGP